MEGVRYGLYVGLMVHIPAAYSTYAMYPYPYSPIMTWFLLGTISSVLGGILLSMIYGKKQA
ncbi:MAG: hypothetical protein FJ218_03530 [Ignavibacteria bacterium]|nr:hypothetical protein [Ignavibacteria bacterium]